MNRNGSLIVLLTALLSCPGSIAQTADERLAIDLSYCSVVAMFISSVPDGADPANKESIAGWKKKSLIYNGGAVALTSREYASTQADEAIARFQAETGRSDRGGTTQEKFRLWMNAIDACDASLKVNRDRLLEIARQRKQQ
jgi:hypothetical protein